MKKLFLTIFSLVISLQLIACKRDIPEPELNDKSIKKTVSSIAVLANSFSEADENNFIVNYHISNQDVFIECIAKNVTFRSDSLKNKIGKIVVYLNDKKITEVQSATFVLKGLPKGEHKIKLEVVNQKNIPYGISKQFTVNI